MRVLEKTIEIDATPDEVWDVLTDFADYEEWNPFVTSITGPAVAGARLAVVLSPPGGRAITMKPTVRARGGEPAFRLARPPGRPGDLRRRPRIPDRAGRRRHDRLHPTRDVPRHARAVRGRVLDQRGGGLRPDEPGPQGPGRGRATLVGAMFSNSARWGRNASSALPVGPLRCLAMMISALPRSSDSWL